MIEILTSSALNSIQDLGRFGYLHFGVGRCGAMDRLALQMGNALLGNPLGSAGIEVAWFPFRILFHRATAFAVTGADCAATLDDERLPPNWRRGARAGQTLVLAAPVHGARAYVTFDGGIDVPLVLESRSTDQKGGFGGHLGRGLERGDRLPLSSASDERQAGKTAAFGAALGGLTAHSHQSRTGTTALRVLRAAEFEEFTAESREAFFSASWRLTHDSNRTGARFTGPTLRTRAPLELLSHGILSGTVQIPPSGCPMVQLADANTCGGYPTIATVIEADLWRLGQAPLGSAVTFVETDRDSAIEELREDIRQLAELQAMSALLAKQG